MQELQLRKLGFVRGLFYRYFNGNVFRGPHVECEQFGVTRNLTQYGVYKECWHVPRRVGRGILMEPFLPHGLFVVSYHLRSFFHKLEFKKMYQNKKRVTIYSVVS